MKDTVRSTFGQKKTVQRVCIVLCVLILAASVFLSIRFRGSMMSIRGMQLPISSLNGCLQVVMSLLCIILVLTDARIGFRYALVFLGFSIFGSTRTMIVTKSLMTAPGTFNAIIFVIAIWLISKQIRESNRIAVTDSVTGLLNRYAFDRDIRAKIRSGERGRIAFIHLEGFLPVNANLGRRYGDELLTVVANRIRTVSQDRGTAYKIEGSEYALIIPQQSDHESVVESVIHFIEETITLNKDGVPSNCYLTAFAGIAEFGGDDKDADSVMKCADIAMNYAMKSGTTKIASFNDEMRQTLERQIYVERLVKDSLRNGWFYLVYQPQYTIYDRRLRGFETLIRMNAPDGVRIPPVEFIGIAELSDLIFDIDEFVLSHAMREFREICYSSGNTITLAINISAKNIARPGFADRLLTLVKENNFPPECLEIEITEYSFAQDANNTIENIKKLRDNQVMIALDDFGTGYTSLEQLMKLPINLVKIDKSLIDNIIRNEMNMDFVKSVIYMGHIMDAEVIAEGVEYDSQVECLKELDCDFIQGYVWGKPTDFDEAREIADEALDMR